MPIPTPCATNRPAPSGPRCLITSHIAVTSSREGVPPRVAIPAIPHMNLDARLMSFPATFAQLHADLVANEPQRRLEPREALKRDVWIEERTHQTLRRTHRIQIH